MSIQWSGFDEEKELIVLCDESDRKGEFFSNFFGGVLVGGSQYEKITERLNACKSRLNLFQEVKWARVTPQYLDKYFGLVDAFFDEVEAGHVKGRVMFTQNAFAASRLTQQDRDLGYFKLYYQFLRHIFGLEYVVSRHDAVRLRILLDDMPHSTQKKRQFKSYLAHLPHVINPVDYTLIIEKQDIAEVKSHQHVLLQCADIVLGAMCFRLNNKHKAKPPGSRFRGKRTLAKDKLYKHMLARICKLRPNFNVGVTTGTDRYEERWLHPYRHWCFRAKDVVFDRRLTKGYKK